MITGLLRVRNEDLILEDTIRHFKKYCSHIVAYDDASTDRTVDILTSFDNITVIQGHTHEPQNESVHREKCRQRITTPYTLVFDADERLSGEMPMLGCDGYVFNLYDAYMTKECQSPYVQGKLEELPRMFGPECRRILMLFRTDKFSYQGVWQREPVGEGHTVSMTSMNVKHYGKALSVDHWEETCDYYGKWPEPYGSKWRARKGKAIHDKSDYGEPLYSWEDVVKNGMANKW